MKKCLYILLIICTFNTNVYSANKNVKHINSAESDIPRLTFGAEWSYIGTVHYNTRYNFFNTEGYRQNRSESISGYWSNAEALLHIGYNLTPHLNLSVYTGIMGIADIHHAVPLSFRGTYYFGEHDSDRWLAFADLGTGISIKEEPQEIWTGKVGGGYRVTLSRDAKLDFITAFRLCCTHPQIKDGEDIISLQWTNRNTALVKSFSIGMAITF